MKRLTQTAFFLIVVLVIVRATTLETLREPFEVTPGSAAYPRGLGAAGSVVLDWLALLAPILILARAAFDRTFTLARSWCFVPLILLALWTGISATWASDKFAAVIGASHFVAAVAIFWTTAQLVRNGLRVRFIAGVCIGLLLVLVAYGLIYRWVELPDMIRSIEQRWDQILTERGWAAGSFMAVQFRKNVMSGAMVGFSASPNTLAAVLVMLCIVAAGVVAQRLIDRDQPGWAVMIALPIPLAFIVIYYTHSRTAFATPVIAIGMLAMFVALKRKLATPRGHAIAFACVFASFVVCAIALISYGIRHGNLAHDSLNFRWKYWVGSSRLIAAHPLRGVGWSNFGDAYLAVRELAASEEIKDPHNLFVRFATETGFVGLALAIAWLIGMWFVITRPIAKPQPREVARATYARSVALQMLIWTSVSAIALNVLFSVDLAQDMSWIFLELMKRVLYAGLILIGLILGVVRSFEKQDLDERDAPWVRRAIVIAIAIFLVHNLIDFSLFESGPLWLFMMLCGVAVGTNAPERASRRSVTLTSMTALSLIWLAALFAIVVPVAVAESRASDADAAIRSNKPREAATLLKSAFDALPFSNGDYLFRAGTAQLSIESPDALRETFRRAMNANPNSAQYPRRLADLEARLPNPDVAAVRELFDRALALNPNDVSVRLDYAQMLDRFGLPTEAIEQYRIALTTNDGLSPDEPKRLKSDEIEPIRQRLAAP